MSDIFETRDLVLATYIKYKGVDLASGYKEDIKSWVFEDPEECNKLSLDLKNSKALVEPMQYESCRRNLLGMVHDSRL